MRKILIFLFNLLMLLLVYFCKESTSGKITHLVNEWEGRGIVYPSQTYFTILGRDIISDFPILNKKYSIVTVLAVNFNYENG